MLAIEGFFCILIHLKVKPIRLSPKGFFVILICLYCKFQGYSRVLLWIIFIKYNLRKTLLACATYTPVCGQPPCHSNDTWRSIQLPNSIFVSDVWKVSAFLTQWGMLVPPFTEVWRWLPYIFLISSLSLNLNFHASPLNFQEHSFNLLVL
jgi:hypothetical protein